MSALGHKRTFRSATIMAPEAYIARALELTARRWVVLLREICDDGYLGGSFEVVWFDRAEVSPSDFSFKGGSDRLAAQEGRNIELQSQEINLAEIAGKRKSLPT